jgi:hypothetical protein
LKKLLISIAGPLMVAAGLHAQTTTYTGQIKDLALNPVTSGQVTFTLAPSTDSTMPGTGRFTPRTITCNISGSGTLSASGGFGACTVASNTALSPAGTSYRICIQPGFPTTGSCFYDYATGGTKDISTIAPTLRTGPLNYNGVQGPPIDVQGVWSSTQTYSKGQVVSYNNVIYLSLVASNLNQTPSTSPSAWSVVMSPPAVISNPSLSQTITQAPGTSLTVNILCSGTGPINARTCFGATGNANGNSGGCSITAGTTTLTCPSGLNFNAADIGKTMYIAGAGSGGGTLQTSITHIVSTNVVFVGNNAVTTVTGAAVFYATDDTVALQAAFNAARTAARSLYIPAGVYLHHGLDFTSADIRIFGDSTYAVTMLVAAAVTNPTKVNSGAPTVGIDISGSSRNMFDHLNVWGGWQNGMGDLAPTIDLMAARTTSDFSLEHTFESDTFITFGPYAVFVYGYEQSSWKDCHFEGDGATVNGLLYFSANNTPGFQSPYRNFLGTSTSMLGQKIFGGATEFSGTGKHIVLDQGGAEGIYDYSIRDAFVSIGGGGTFLSDTGGSPVRDIEISNVYAETQNCPTCTMINMTAAAWMWDIRTMQIYNTNGGVGLTASPYTFAGGFLGSYIQADAAGPVVPQLISPSCRGSIINLGQEDPSQTCQDYTLAPNVNTGGGVQAVNNIAGVANIPMSGTSTIGAGYGNNATNGGGETDLYNMFFGGGFTFWSNSSSGYNLLGSLDSAGMHIPTGTRYRVGTSQGFTGTKTVGTCVFTIIGGIITNVTGC